MLCFFSHVVTGASSIFAIDFSMIFSWFSYTKKNDIYFRPAVCLNNKTLNSWTIPTNNRRVFNFSSSFVNFHSLLFPFLFFPFLSSLFFPTSWTIFLNDTRIIKKNTRERGIGKKLSSRDHDVKNISFFLSLEIYEGGIEDNSRSESESETGTELGGRKSASSACIVKSRVFFFFFSFFFSPFFFVYVCICMRVRVCLFIIFISLVKMQSMRLGNQARLLIIEQSFCETIFLIFFYLKSQ